MTPATPEPNESEIQIAVSSALAALRFVDGVIAAARVSGMSPRVMTLALLDAAGSIMREDLVTSAEADAERRESIYLEAIAQLSVHVAGSRLATPPNRPGDPKH